MNFRLSGVMSQYHLEEIQSSECLTTHFQISYGRMDPRFTKQTIFLGRGWVEKLDRESGMEETYIFFSNAN
jgi:hypothetical protein